MLRTRLILRYEIVAILGEGGFARVYRARDCQTGREVALKVLLPGTLRTDRAESLLQEARIVAALQHPNIVAVYDCGVFDGAPYFAMELLEGATLAVLMARQGAVPALEAIAWGKSILTGLEVAHGAGVVHGDIHPGNLFLTSAGVLKILDFGGGVAQRQHSSLAPGAEDRLPGLIGTSGYIAPELYLAQEPSIRSDIYAVGVTLFRAIAGRAPFAGLTSESISHQVVRQRAPALASVAPNVPAWIGNAIDRALARDPEARFADARSFATALAGQEAPTAAKTRAFVPHAPPASQALAPQAPQTTQHEPLPVADRKVEDFPVPRGRKRWAFALALSLGAVVTAVVAFSALYRRPKSGTFKVTQKCSGAEQLRFENARIEVPSGVGILTSERCQLELVNTVVVADVGVVASGTRVTIRGGTFEGRRAVHLKDGELFMDGAKLDVEQGIVVETGSLATLQQTTIRAEEFGARIGEEADIRIADSVLRANIGVSLGAGSILRMEDSKIQATEFGIETFGGEVRATGSTIVANVGIQGEGDIHLSGGVLEGKKFAFHLNDSSSIQYSGVKVRGNVQK